MSNNRFNLLFYFRKARANSSSALPFIYMRISVGCERTEVSTQRQWDPNRWNTAAGRASGTKEDAKSLNIYLDTLQARVYEAQRQLVADNKPVTVNALKQRLDGATREKARMLIEAFDHHNNQMAQLVGKDCADGTLERYTVARNHTVAFLQWKWKVSDIDILDLSYEFATDFEFWLKTVRNCGHNTSMKYISNLKKIINICLKNGWLPRDPFLGYKMAKREVIREALSQEEIDALTNKVFAVDRLTVIRDLFLFSCYTGLAYVDIKKLKRTEIATGVDGGKWIFTKRTKTDVPSRIPLLSAALSILEKYENNPVCINKDVLLPVPSNQKMNSYLKEVADLCGITKNMTVHTARHTFATTVTLTNGVPIETVSKMLGHRNLKTTQHYAKILDKKVSDDMMVLRKKLDSRNDATSL